MKKVIKKIADVLRIVFGYAIGLCLFAGALCFGGYLVALAIGGDTAAMICDVIYNRITPVIIYTSTVSVLLGLVVMYLSGETALTAKKKANKK